MKIKKMLLPITVLCFFMLTGLKSSIAQNVEVAINLPYSGNYNEWEIIFTNNNGTYTFYTDDDTFDSQILGTVPADTYNIEFNSVYSWERFDFGVCGPNYYHFQANYPCFTYYSAVIEDGTSLQIDAGY